MDYFYDYRERRNEFWTAFGQIVLAVFVALVLFILLLTKTIGGGEGLPILSAIVGFAIAKNIETRRNNSPANSSDDS